MARDQVIPTPETEPNQTNELFQKLHDYYSQTLPEQGFKQDDDPNMWENPASRQGLYIISTKDSLAIEWHEKDEQEKIKKAYKLIYLPKQKVIGQHDTDVLLDIGVELWYMTNMSPQDFEYAIITGLLSPKVLFRYEPEQFKELITETITKIREVDQFFETSINDILASLPWHIKMQFLTPEFIAVASPQTLKAIIEAVIEAENHPTTRNKAKARMLLTASRIPGARHLINWWSKRKSS